MAKTKSKILLAEDDTFLGSLLTHELEIAGFKVTAVPDGEAALEALAKEDPPDVLITNLILPGVLGFDLLKAVQGEPRLRNTKTIVLSNLSQPDDVAKAKELGASAYCQKNTITIAELLETIRAQLQ